MWNKCRHQHLTTIHYHKLSIPKFGWRNSFFPKFRFGIKRKEAPAITVSFPKFRFEIRDSASAFEFWKEKKYQLSLFLSQSSDLDEETVWDQRQHRHSASAFAKKRSTSYQWRVNSSLWLQSISFILLSDEQLTWLLYLSDQQLRTDNQLNQNLEGSGAFRKARSPAF